uniref:Uncharacterized protein n=1 Tax=Lepeophtheirus salmonis TaxID=72036 RepID=A0A0K2V3F5_LEPSM
MSYTINSNRLTILNIRQLHRLIFYVRANKLSIMFSSIWTIGTVSNRRREVLSIL